MLRFLATIGLMLSISSYVIASNKYDPRTLEDMVPASITFEGNGHMFTCPVTINADATVLATFDHESKLLSFRLTAVAQDKERQVHKPIKISTPKDYHLADIAWTYCQQILILTFLNSKTGDSKVEIVDMERRRQYPILDEEHESAAMFRLSSVRPNEALITWVQTAWKKAIVSNDNDQTPEVNEDGVRVERHTLGPEERAVGLYNLLTNEIKIVARFQENFNGFLVDQNLVIRAAFMHMVGPEFSSLKIVAPSPFQPGSWVDLFNASSRDNDFWVGLLSKDSRFLYFIDGHLTDYPKIVKLCLENGEQQTLAMPADIATSLVANVLDDSEQAPDILGYKTAVDARIFCPMDGTPQGGRDFLAYLIQSHLKHAVRHFSSFERGLNGHLEWPFASPYFLIQEAPNLVSVYDRHNGKVIEHINPLPRLDAIMQTPEKVLHGSVMSQDGFPVYYYLTKPDGNNLPCVVQVHGGPTSRDNYGYEPDVQCLAKLMGIATLRVNFRGSTGYGKKFRYAGYGDWGGKPMDDILLVVNHFIKEGAIDKDRLVVAGASYGGYATMAMLAFHPEVFKAGYAYCGVSDLVQHMKDRPEIKNVEDGLTIRMGGDPAVPADKRRLQDQSPLFSANNITSHLLLITGDRDEIVLPKQSQMMAERMEGTNLPHTYAILKGVGHCHEARKEYVTERTLYVGYVAQMLGLPVPHWVGETIEKDPSLVFEAGREHITFLKPVVVASAEKAEAGDKK